MFSTENFRFSKSGHQTFQFRDIRVLKKIYLVDMNHWTSLEESDTFVEPTDMVLHSVFLNNDGDPGFNYIASNGQDPELTGKDIVNLQNEGAILLASAGCFLPEEDDPSFWPFNEKWRGEVEAAVHRVASDRQIEDYEYELYDEEVLEEIDLTEHDERHAIGTFGDYILFLHIKEGVLDLEFVCEPEPAFIQKDNWFGHQTTVFEPLNQYEFPDSTYDVANDVGHDNIGSVVFKIKLGDIDNG